MTIGQGDAYSLPIKIGYLNGGSLDMKDVVKVEFAFGPIVKVWESASEGAIRYDNDTGIFSVPLTQGETQKLSGTIQCQARVKYSDGSVRKTKDFHASISESLTNTAL